ncbi:hypothetical protein CARUB_v10021972mg [Capsella rubella]|uniref:F-box domain-containing protein n=1 Tax=Capsella rubella TaxID=81985 RepID=R0GF48_9BRAS|nr:putative F-box protein At1g70960 [Capsella rubella]EOA34437.1 hypothetical protein CARUB_v10021972mg [Capsella rubella]
MEDASFDEVPEELQMRIMSRLPLKSLVTCLCVAKKWATLISTKAFRDRYLDKSMTRPRFLFVSGIHRTEALFHSVYQKELLSSGQQQIRTNDAPLAEVSQPVRGLICLHDGSTNVVICNPGAKKFLSLPQIQRPDGATIRCFFGYDESNDVFKVLCAKQFGDGKGSKEFQVYTVKEGAVEDSSWRRITCEHDHSPLSSQLSTQGLCIEGVLYYVAQPSSGKSLVIMCFNLSSEDFSVIEVPERVENSRVNDHRWKLVNYKGELAMVDDYEFKSGILDEWSESDNGFFDIWIRKEAARNWENKNFEIPHWGESVGFHKFFFKGTIATGELVFAPYCWPLRGQLYVLCYDTDTRDLRRFDVEGMVDRYFFVRTFLDHVDSTWLMSK